ncbi:MAG: DUF6569 family protein [Planctomycetota bacterium]
MNLHHFSMPALVVTLAVAPAVASRESSASGQDAEAGGVRDVRDVTLGPAINLDGVMVYPLLARSHGSGSRPAPPGRLDRVDMLSTAVAERLARLVEAPDGTVAVFNDSRNHIFVPAGQILRGGSQDRVVVYDALVPPGDEPVALALLSVEQGRQDLPGAPLAAPDEIADAPVRRSATLQQSQEGVWAATRKALEASGTASPTERYPSPLLWSEPWLSRALQWVRDGLAGYPQVVGLALGFDGRFQVADLFRDPALFRAGTGALVDSYVLYARLLVLEKPRPEDTALSGFDLQRFLLGVETAAAPRLGPGTRLTLLRSTVDAAIVELRCWDETLVRVTALAGRAKLRELSLRDPTPPKPPRDPEGGGRASRRERRPPPPDVVAPRSRSTPPSRPAPAPPSRRGGGS